MADKIYMMGVLIYFMCPTGFAMPMLISPLYKGDEDEDFVAAIKFGKKIKNPAITSI